MLICHFHPQGQCPVYRRHLASSAVAQTFSWHLTKVSDPAGDLARTQSCLACRSHVSQKGRHGGGRGAGAGQGNGQLCLRYFSFPRRQLSRGKRKDWLERDRLWPHGRVRVCAQLRGTGCLDTTSHISCVCPSDPVARGADVLLEGLPIKSPLLPEAQLGRWPG